MLGTLSGPVGIGCDALVVVRSFLVWYELGRCEAVFVVGEAAGYFGVCGRFSWSGGVVVSLSIVFRSCFVVLSLRSNGVDVGFVACEWLSSWQCRRVISGTECLTLDGTAFQVS